MRFLAATGTIPFAATAANSWPLLRRGCALNVGASLRAAADEEEELEVGSDRQPHSDEEDDGGRPLDLRRNSEESSEEGEDEEDEDAFFRPIKQGEHGQHCHVTLILYVMYTVPCTK